MEDKPFAITETGYIAETLDLPELGIFQEGRQEWQAAYVQQLMAELGRLDAEFVVWFVPRDHDLMNETLQQMGVPLGPAFFVWRDTGLLDGDGNARPGLRIWQSGGGNGSPASPTAILTTSRSDVVRIAGERQLLLLRAQCSLDCFWVF
ncbi:MAG: hypothetical protein ACC742_12055, partial [Thermoanaerobaculales bacterium]